MTFNRRALTDALDRAEKAHSHEVLAHRRELARQAVDKGRVTQRESRGVVIIFSDHVPEFSPRTLRGF